MLHVRCLFACGVNYVLRSVGGYEWQVFGYWGKFKELKKEKDFPIAFNAESNKDTFLRHVFSHKLFCFFTIFLSWPNSIILILRNIFQNFQ